MPSTILQPYAPGVSISRSGRDPYQGDFTRYVGPQPALIAAGIATESWFPVHPHIRAWGKTDDGAKWAVTALADGTFQVTRRAKPEPPSAPSNIVRLPVKSVHGMRRQPETNTCHTLWDLLDLAREGEIHGFVLAAYTRDGHILMAGADCPAGGELGRVGTVKLTEIRRS